jgi:hypothetical protein
MYLDPLGSAGGCTPNGDGSGCPGDIIADKAFGTCGGDFTLNNCGDITSAESLNYGLGGWNGGAVDANENLYAMDLANSRAIVFPNASSLSGSLTATAVFGQGGSFTSGNPDYDGIAADSLGSGSIFTGVYVAIGIAVDSSCDVYIADSGNNRVLGYNQPVAPCGSAPTPTATSTAATPTPTATATATSTLKLQQRQLKPRLRQRRLLQRPPRLEPQLQQLRQPRRPRRQRRRPQLLQRRRPLRL